MGFVVLLRSIQIGTDLSLLSQETMKNNSTQTIELKMLDVNFSQEVPTVV